MALIIKFYKERRGEKKQKTRHLVGVGVTKRKKKLNTKLQSKHLQVVLLLRETGEVNAHVGHYQVARNLTQLAQDFSCKIKRKQQCHLLFALKNC